MQLSIRKNSISFMKSMKYSIKIPDKMINARAQICLQWSIDNSALNLLTNFLLWTVRFSKKPIAKYAFRSSRDLLQKYEPPWASKVYKLVGNIIYGQFTKFISALCMLLCRMLVGWKNVKKLLSFSLDFLGCSKVHSILHFLRILVTTHIVLNAWHYVKI